MPVTSSVSLQSAVGVCNIFVSGRRKGPAVCERRLLELIVWLYDWLELILLSLFNRNGQGRLMLCSAFSSSTTVLRVELSKREEALMLFELFAIVWVGRCDTVTGDISVDGLSGPMTHRFD